MNARLKGYTIRIEKLDFHPIGLSLDLENLSIYQTAQAVAVDGSTRTVGATGPELGKRIRSCLAKS
jgi:hypothetical protein